VADAEDAADAAPDSPDSVPIPEPAVFLPSDRSRDRALDRCRRLLADGRWSDAATILDELLADDADAFVDAGPTIATRASIRAAAVELIAGLPRSGRDAYRRLSGKRAERALAAAIARDDADAIEAVARRWFATPAGVEAGLIVAVRALEADRPALAAAWLDRVAGSSDAEAAEPTLSVMRAIAHLRGGDEAAAGRLLAEAARAGGSLKLAGQTLTASQVADQGPPWLRRLVGPHGPQTMAAADWRQYRGRPDRNPIVEASPPLLVPRYRVPLVRHPEEARRLEALRRAAAEAGRQPLPAAMPVAAEGRLVTRSPLGILAIDFATGRRIWLQAAVPLASVDGLADDPASDVLQRSFDDLTSGQLACDGRLVFAVESDPAATSLRETRFHGPGVQAADWDQGNVLSAYDLADGSLRWRLPRAEAEGAAAAPVAGGDRDPGAGLGFEQDDGLSATWYLGPPLVAHGDLYLLVEQGGEVRLEVREAASGRLKWSQPLAAYDSQEAIDLSDGWPRRLAGLSPALADGLLICPVGGGCVVAVDLPLRSLRWATAYPRAEAGREPAWQGPRRPGTTTPPPGSEPCPIIAGDHVLLAPHDTGMLLCLAASDGRTLWSHPREGLLAIAGVVDERVILIVDDAVEAVEVATGRRLWRLPLDEGQRPSGRGILTAGSLLLPCETPAVLEIALSDGRIIGRRETRGGSLPGNLVIYRGEVISQGLDTLDVFHQEATLDSRIETALIADPASPWAAYWLAQEAIEQGDVARGLEQLAAATAEGRQRVSPRALTETLARAIERDFTAAARWLEEAGQLPGGRVRETADLAPAVVDGYLGANDPDNAWRFLEPLLKPAAGDWGPELRPDPVEPLIMIATDRWLRSRVELISAAADEPLRRAIAARCEAVVAEALATDDPEVRRRSLAAACERLGRQPAAAAARRAIVADAETGAAKRWAVRGQLLALEAAGPATAIRNRPEQSEAWPLGRVEHRLHGRRRDAGTGHPHLLPTPLAGAATNGSRAAAAAIDTARRQLILSDAWGRPITDPLPLDGFTARGLGLWVNETALVEVAVAGRAAYIRTQAGLAAYDTGTDRRDGRGLWRRADLGTAAAGSGAARWGGGIGGQVARDAGVPLGMRIVEPDERPRDGGRGMIALPEGLVVPGLRSVSLLDPVTGETRWERRRLPAGLSWHSDGESLVGCTTSGHESLVLRLADGRLRHTAELPHHRRRLAAHGRRVAAVRSIDELPGRFIARRVRLELFDPVDREVRSLGDFDGDARATATGDGRLAVLSPAGELVMLSLVDGSLVFRQQLAGAPRRFDRLQVIPWADRYLVFAGIAADDDEEEISPLADLMFSTAANPAVSGGLWALSRDDGRPLWPVPAMIERQCLHTHQPSGLPVLTFCRLWQPAGRDRPALGLLCLDKRTGHAVFHQEAVRLSAPTFPGATITGDPETGSVIIGTPGSVGGGLELRFTGEPMPPRPPFQSRGRPPTAAGELAEDIDRLEPPRPAGPRGLPNLFQ
jgi:outer membrane protein assembly factor BamB